MVTDRLVCDHFLRAMAWGLDSIAIVIPSDLCYDKANDDSPESLISSLITSLTND